MKRQLRYYICNSPLALSVIGTRDPGATKEDINLDPDRGLVCIHPYSIQTRPTSLSSETGAFTFNLSDNVIQHAPPVEPDFVPCHPTSYALDNSFIAIRSEGKLPLRGFSGAMTANDSFHPTIVHLFARLLLRYENRYRIDCPHSLNAPGDMTTMLQERHPMPELCE